MAPRIIRKKAAAAATRTRPSPSSSTSIKRSGVSRGADDSFSSFPTTKEDKRRLKHSALVSRIEKANSKTTKRRRPSKKLTATLESLADALPEALNGEEGQDVIGGGKLRHASLKSRPGALKRKEKVEGLERERFAKNMAQMAGHRQGGVDPDQVPGSESSTNSMAARWAALRGHIQSSITKGT